MKIIITLLFLSTNFSFSQIKKKELIGEWYSNNAMIQFVNKDTILFNQKVLDVDNKKCDFIKWEINKKDFKQSEVNLCKANAKVTKHYATENIKIRKTDFGQVIEYFQDKKLIEKFRIVKLEKSEQNKLILMRFDKLNEKKLFKYIDSLITKVLKYKPNFYENKNLEKIKISDGNPNSNIIIRDNRNENVEPLIVVNGHPLENRELLKNLLLVETYGITYITKEKSALIYGYRALNGVVILQTSEKHFKIAKEKNGS